MMPRQTPGPTTADDRRRPHGGVRSQIGGERQSYASKMLPPRSTWGRTGRSRVRRVRFRSTKLRRPLTLIRHTGLRGSDAFVVSYPRSGTTWTLFMLSEAITGRPMTFGQEQNAVPYIGSHRRVPSLLPGEGRLIWSHEIHRVGSHRVIYLVRDPRSVVLSEYRWQEMQGYYSGGLNAFVDDFVRGASNPWGAWDRHVEHWLDHPRRTSAPLHLVRYEDLRVDPVTVLDSMLAFLGRSRPTDAIHRIVERNRIEQMRDKERRSAIPKIRGDLTFVGEGGVDLWRQELPDHCARAIEDRFGRTMASFGYR